MGRKMSLLSCTSNASAWRGYEYYESKNVVSWKQIGESQFKGFVKGSADQPYHVIIDVAHPRKSTCNCPFADGKRKICKHQVALFFTIFPNEAKKYIKEIEDYEQEQEQREQERYGEIVKYVNSLSTAELRNALINALEEQDERNKHWY